MNVPLCAFSFLNSTRSVVDLNSKSAENALLKHCPLRLLKHRHQAKDCRKLQNWPEDNELGEKDDITSIANDYYFLKINYVSKAARVSTCQPARHVSMLLTPFAA